MRSKSVKQIKTYCPDQKIANTSLQLKKLTMQELRSQLEELKEKINQSRPLLQCIYDKVKKKERLYVNKIQKLKEYIQQERDKNNEYKQLYEEGLRLMIHNNIQNKYQNSSNFSLSNIYQKYHKKHQDYNQNNHFPKQGISQFHKQEQKQRQFKIPLDAKDIYLKYRKKLNEVTKQAQKNTLTKRLQIISKSMKQDIEQIKKEKNQQTKKTKDILNEEYEDVDLQRYRNAKQRYAQLQSEKLNQ